VYFSAHNTFDYITYEIKNPKLADEFVNIFNKLYIQVLAFLNMVEKEALTEVSYSLVIFALGAVAFGVSKLLALETLLSYWFAGVIVLLASATCVSALIHFWRYS
jgi:hypothetical protein